jgi:signal recognition particle receptor subunit beta
VPNAPGYTRGTVVFFNYTTMQMTAKVVYYGPGLCGKTTNLQAIHQRTAPQSRGDMVSLETETDRTLFFDLLPLDVGVIGGMKVRLQLYTVPGQVFYNATRKLVLKGVDGIVFVADSQTAALDANIESLSNLKANLAELALTFDDVPLVFQYNKRDIRNIVPVSSLNEALNPGGAPYYEAAALHGIGVFETLKGISRMAITSVRRKLAEEPRPPAQAGMPARSVEWQTGAAKPGAVPAPAAGDADPLASLVGGPDVEFAAEDTDKHLVPVKTKGMIDIGQELEKLRAMAVAPPPKPAASPASRELEKRLQSLVPGQAPRQEFRRKASVEVPSRLLKNASSMKVHLGFDGEGDEEFVRDALTVTLVGNKRLERLTLHIELDIKGKT